jgi:hypothetical protein
MVAEEMNKLMQAHFGSNGEEMLKAQMASVGAADLEALTDRQKQDLAEAILKNCFGAVMSPMKMRMVACQLYGALGVDQQNSGEDAGMI